MTTEWHNHLLVPASYSTAPEFRAGHKSFSRAYSGPEQRQRGPHYFTEDPWLAITTANLPASLSAS